MGHRRVDEQSSLRRRPTVRFAEVAVSGRAMLASSILSLLLFNGGCSVIIAEVGWVDPREIKEGSTRAAVQEKLGNPSRSERTREGARIDTYEYQKQPQDGHADIACDILTFGGVVRQRAGAPGPLRRNRYSPVCAVKYSVRRSSSPQAMLCGCSGPVTVPRCVPSAEMIQSPPGPET